MYCLHPIQVHKWYDDSTGKKVRSANLRLVPCGKCVACLSRLRNQWTYRLTEENNCSSYSYFVTLTYDDLRVPRDTEGHLIFCKKDVQNYFKRLRYYLDQFDVKCTYYAISEFGANTFRPHYHALVFIKGDDNLRYVKVLPDAIRDCWDKGYTVCKPVSPANIHYVTKYSVKSLAPDNFKDKCHDKPFVLSSKLHYIGSGAFDRLEQQCNLGLISGASGDIPNFVFLNGRRLPMPRIYREKLGVRGNSQPLSDDPRLSCEKYNKWKDQYIRSRGSFDPEGFQKYCNLRLFQYEQQAIKNQINKLEKL